MSTARAGLLLAFALALGCAPEDPFAQLPAEALTPAEVEDAYAVFASGDADAISEVLRDIEARGDFRFVPVLIDLLRSTQLGLGGGGSDNARIVSLERLAQQRFGADWFAWVSWYAHSGIAPPPGYQAFKGRVLARVDPQYARFFGAHPAAISVEEIVWGGTAVDDVRALEAPARLPAQAVALDDAEPVLGVQIGGQAVAYPLAVLGWHEIVNDVVGETPVVVVYCGLCGSSAVFLRGERRFAPAGLVYRGGRLMYDRESDSLWSELTGAPLLGSAVADARPLERVPAVVTDLGAWRDAHPETAVVSVDEEGTPYAQGNPYGRYSLTTESAFPVQAETGEGARPPKQRVFGLEVDGVSKSWPLDVLLEARVLEDEVAGVPVVLVATRGALAGMSQHPKMGRFEYDAGGEVRAYRAEPAGFEPGPAPGLLRDAEGRSWRVTEDALVNDSGTRAPRLAGTLAYWFAWRASGGRS